MLEQQTSTAAVATQPKRKMTILDHALWYAKAGLEIFPLHTPVKGGGCSCGKQECIQKERQGKHPRTANGFKDACTDPEQIREWWTKWPNANIGYRIPDRTLILDADVRHGAPSDRSELIEYVGGPWPDTCEITTGADGGRHIYLLYPGGPVPSQLLPGVEVRASGGYSILSPSLHRSGKRYEFDGVNGRKAILQPAKAPDWLLKRITEKLTEPKSSLTKANPNGDGPVLRNITLASLAGSMRRKGFSQEAIEAALLKENQERFAAGVKGTLSDDEVLEVAKSIGKYPPGPAPSDKPADGSFVVDDTGVHAWVARNRKNEEPEFSLVKIASRVDIEALTRDVDSENWGRLLRWTDRDNHEHRWAMPSELLEGEASQVRAHLLSSGLPFLASAPSLRYKFGEFLQTTPVETRVRCVSQTGWHGDMYALPDTTIGPEGSEAVIYQTPHESENLWKCGGTVEQWRKQIGEKCIGNSRLILSVSAAFAGPLIHLVRAENLGVHIVGLTSTGKSTALYAGGSVCGGGGKDGFVSYWHSTVNGLEALAESHNHGTLFLDELKQIDARYANEAVYLLSNGAGRARMTKTIAARRKLTWELVFVSAGEITLSEHAATAGKRTMGGAEIRLINVAADAGKGLGLFEDLHGMKTPDGFARNLKLSATRCYGTVFREFVDHLVGNREQVIAYVRDQRLRFLNDDRVRKATGEVKRAAERFGLLIAAGEQATAFGLTGWPEGEATKALTRIFHEWLETREGGKGATDTEAGVEAVRSFLQVHGDSRFEKIPLPTSDKRIAIRDRAGFWRTDAETGQPDEYLIFPSVFKKEVCRDHSWPLVLKALDAAKHLNRSLPNMTSTQRLPGLGVTRVYAVRASILGGGE